MAIQRYGHALRDTDDGMDFVEQVYGPYVTHADHAAEVVRLDALRKGVKS
jgi:hypothetical protein